MVLTAAYILWTLQRVFMGVNPSRKNWPDLTPRELVCLTAIVIPFLLLGLWPSLLLSWMELQRDGPGRCPGGTLK